MLQNLNENTACVNVRHNIRSVIVRKWPKKLHATCNKRSK